MGTATRNYFLEVFGETIEIFEANKLRYLVIGSLATSAHFGDPWSLGSDIDLLVTQEDAERALEVFPRHGYATHVRDGSWIYKVAKPNMTIDLIFCSAGVIELDDEIMGRSCLKTFEGLTLRVPSVEDMCVHYILMDSDERPGYWYDAMRYLRQATDWRYLTERGRRLAGRKFLAALLYADAVGIDFPRRAIRDVAASALPG